MKRTLLLGVIVGAAGLVVWAGAVSAGSTRPVRDVELVRLLSPGRVLIVASPSAAPGVISPQRVFLATGAGGPFSAIGPRLPTGTRIEDVFFLDRLRGWISTWSVPHDAVTVYRTRDGGHHWSKAPPTSGHSSNAGAVSTLQFLSPERGWMVTQEPTAPGATLAATTDGGRSWRIADQSLPTVAPVIFRSPTEAWQAGNGLFHSTNGGRTWRRVRSLPAPGARVLYGTPTFQGVEILEPVTRLRQGHAALVVYRSIDDGRIWSVAGQLNVKRSPRPSCVLDDLASPLAFTPIGSSWWAGYYQSGHWHVDRSLDSGRSWVTHIVPTRHTPSLCGQSPATVQANNHTVWLSYTAGRNDGRLYASSDGGSQWHRVLP